MSTFQALKFIYQVLHSMLLVFKTPNNSQFNSQLIPQHSKKNGGIYASLPTTHNSYPINPANCRLRTQLCLLPIANCLLLRCSLDPLLLSYNAPALILFHPTPPFSSNDQLFWTNPGFLLFQIYPGPVFSRLMKLSTQA